MLVTADKAKMNTSSDWATSVGGNSWLFSCWMTKQNLHGPINFLKALECTQMSWLNIILEVKSGNGLGYSPEVNDWLIDWLICIVWIWHCSVKDVFVTVYFLWVQRGAYYVCTFSERAKCCCFYFSFLYYFNNAKYIVFVKFNRKLLKQCKVCWGM